MKPNTQSMEERFREKFVCDINPEEHPFVGMYNEEDNKFEFWNAYKIEAFITSERELWKREVEKKQREELDKIFYMWRGNSPVVDLDDVKGALWGDIAEKMR